MVVGSKRSVVSCGYVVWLSSVVSGVQRMLMVGCCCVVQWGGSGVVVVFHMCFSWMVFMKM